MAIAPGALKPVTLQARLSARYHLQLEIIDRELRGERGSVRALVRRLFRVNGKLRVGDEVKFDVPVYPERGVPISPDFNSYENAARRKEFMSARYVEAFLERENELCSLAADQYSFIRTLSDSPTLRVPARQEVESAWERFGYAMPSCELPEDSIEVSAVLEMRDQDGARSKSPHFFPEWLEEMKFGDSLTFAHEDGGELFVQGPPRGPFLIRCTDAGGGVVAEAPQVEYSIACGIIRQYIRGDAREVIVRALEESGRVAARPPNKTTAPRAISRPPARKWYEFWK